MVAINDCSFATALLMLSLFCHIRLQSYYFSINYSMQKTKMLHLDAKFLPSTYLQYFFSSLV